MDAVVMMRPTAIRMKRRQESPCADHAVQPADAGEATMDRVMADDGEIGDERAGKHGQRDFPSGVFRQNGANGRAHVNRKAQRKDRDRQRYAALYPGTLGYSL